MEFPLFSEFLLWVTGKFHWLNLTIEVVSRKIHFNGDEGFIPREVSQKSPAMKNFTMNAADERFLVMTLLFSALLLMELLKM